MASLMYIFAKRPVSVICYILYSLLCYNQYRMASNFHAMVQADPNGPHVVYGEAVMYGMLFIGMLTIVFVIVIFANAIGRKENKFYLWLSAIVIVQAAAFFKLIM